MILKSTDSSPPLTDIRMFERQMVLVVDDIPANWAAIVDMLPEYEICAAKNGREALGILAHSFADIALLDIEMPEMSGIELFAKMQENSDYASIPVIFVTSSKESQDVQNVIALGAKDYIVKPYTDKILRSKVLHVLSSATEDQARLYLRRKMEKIIGHCRKGNITQAEIVIKDFPKNIYSIVVSLKIKRIITALHNLNPGEAVKTAEEILEGLTITS